MEETILNEIISDLGINFVDTDKNVLSNILNDVIEDALYIANRKHKTDKDNQIALLKSNIKKAVKAIYLQRGTEDVKSNTESGINNTYDNAIDTMQQDIVKQGKRLIIWVNKLED